jgi:hypothetical protein
MPPVAAGTLLRPVSDADPYVRVPADSIGPDSTRSPDFAEKVEHTSLAVNLGGCRRRPNARATSVFRDVIMEDRVVSAGLRHPGR